LEVSLARGGGRGLEKEREVQLTREGNLRIKIPSKKRELRPKKISCRGVTIIQRGTSARLETKRGN